MLEEGVKSKPTNRIERHGLSLSIACFLCVGTCNGSGLVSTTSEGHLAGWEGIFETSKDEEFPDLWIMQLKALKWLKYLWIFNMS